MNVVIIITIIIIYGFVEKFLQSLAVYSNFSISYIHKIVNTVETTHNNNKHIKLKLKLYQVS